MRQVRLGSAGDHCPCRSAVAASWAREPSNSGGVAASNRSEPPEANGVTPEALTAARADFLTTVDTNEPHRAGGHREALGCVLADLHPGWSLTYDYGPLTLAAGARADQAAIGPCRVMPACAAHGSRRAICNPASAAEGRHGPCVWPHAEAPDTRRRWSPDSGLRPGAGHGTARLLWSVERVGMRFAASTGLAGDAGLSTTLCRTSSTWCAGDPRCPADRGGAG